MNADKTGGSAFPGESDHQSGNTIWHSSGMTLRQYYAAKVLANPNFKGSPFERAEWAFELADALINFEEQGK